MIPVFQPLINGLSAPPHPEKTKLKKGLLPLFHSIPLTELAFKHIYIYFMKLMKMYFKSLRTPGNQIHMAQLFIKSCLLQIC